MLISSAERLPSPRCVMSVNIEQAMRQVLMEKVTWESRSNGQSNSQNVFAVQAISLRGLPARDIAPEIVSSTLRYDLRGAASPASFKYVTKIMRENTTELPHDALAVTTHAGYKKLLNALQARADQREPQPRLQAQVSLQVGSGARDIAAALATSAAASRSSHVLTRLALGVDDGVRSARAGGDSARIVL